MLGLKTWNLVLIMVQYHSDNSLVHEYQARDIGFYFFFE